KGRPWVRGPGGARIYVDEQGRPLSRQPGDYAGDTGAGSSAAGSGTGVKEAARPEDEPAAPGTVTGSVVDDHGQAFAGAVVELQSPKGVQRATAGDDGRYSLEGVPAEVPLAVTASSRGAVSRTLSARLAPGAKLALEPLVLARDGAVRGVVRAAESGAPVAGALVRMHPMSNSRSAISVTTGNDGGFIFDQPTPGEYRVQVTRDGYTPRILNNVTPPRELEVQLAPGTVISGTVTSADGSPLQDALVNCDFVSEPHQFWHTETRTDETGFYSVKCQPESQHNEITARAAGFASQTRRLVVSGASGVDFALSPSGNAVLRGRTVLRSGGPVADATFFVLDAAGNPMGIIQRQGPGSDGSFWLEVPTGSGTLVVRSGSLAELRVPFAATAGGVTELGDLQMDAGAAVSGFVHAQGEPQVRIGHATIRAGAAVVTADGTGAYRLEGLPLGEVLLQVSHPSWQGTSTTITVKTPGEELKRDLVLVTGGQSVRVLVKAADTGTPLKGARVTTDAFGHNVVTGDDGIATLGGISADRATIRVALAGYATTTVQIRTDAPANAPGAPAQEVLLKPGAALEGRFTTEGKPVASAMTVEVWNSTSQVATVQTDSDGRWSTAALPLGTYFAGLPALIYLPRKVELTAEGGVLELDVGPIATLRGRVLRPDGNPHANAGMYILSTTHSYYQATAFTGPNGEYEVPNLPAGEWTFSALKSQGDQAAQYVVPVTVTGGGVKQMDIHLPPATGVVAGRVTYPDGRPVSGARVCISNLSVALKRSMLAAYVVTDAEGRYRAERLENGVTMRARVGGYPDEAATAIGFSDAFVVPGNDAPLEVNMVVAERGYKLTGVCRRADGGPLGEEGPGLYLEDEQGRRAGNFFGGGRPNAWLTVYDVPPGRYKLVATTPGCLPAEVVVVVGEGDVTDIEILLHVEPRGSEKP
ncbi:MAG: carboxypeptidase regulatory-like domain-containing protein, partial [Planctomycetes bacterium]|nr:carboxypeptidase regulatory-like domain-containing protein [Planctomycetota bacterium]